MATDCSGNILRQLLDFKLYPCAMGIRRSKVSIPFQVLACAGFACEAVPGKVDMQEPRRQTNSRTAQLVYVA